jgi:hypothetical protein
VNAYNYKIKFRFGVCAFQDPLLCSSIQSTIVTEEFEAVIVGVDHVQTAVAAAHTVVKRQPTANMTAHLAFPTLYKGLFFLMMILK